VVVVVYLLSRELTIGNYDFRSWLFPKCSSFKIFRFNMQSWTFCSRDLHLVLLHPKFYQYFIRKFFLSFALKIESFRNFATYFKRHNSQLRLSTAMTFHASSVHALQRIGLYENSSVLRKFYRGITCPARSN